MQREVSRRFVAVCLLVAMVMLQSPLPVASADKSLSKLSGTVGTAADANGSSFSEVVTNLVVQDNQFAITRDKSIGLLTLPDSSQVTLGANTKIQVGAFTTSTSD